MNGFRARRASSAVEKRQDLGAPVPAANGDEAGNRRDRATPARSRARGHRADRPDIAASRTRSRRRPARTRAGGISFTPRSNSSRPNALAGATTARRAPGSSARGLTLTRTAPSRRRSRDARRSRAPAGEPAVPAGAGPGHRRRREEPLLRALLPLQRVLDAPVRQPAVLHGVDQRFERRRLLVVASAADQHAVAARFDGEHRGRRHRVLVGDGLHLEIVAQDDPVVAQLLAKQPRHDAAGQGGRTLLVERRNQDVGGHDRRDAGGHGRPERHELHLRAAAPAGARRAAARGASRCSCRRARENASRTPRCPRPGASGSARRRTGPPPRPCRTAPGRR